jgi:hypothetical protein
MDFLRDHGGAVGCYSNRHIGNIDLDGNFLEETYGLGHWRSLAFLERWAESHPSHLKIFVTFFRVAEGLQKFRLYHEVSVFGGGDQIYEYVSCHPHTGMMQDRQLMATKSGRAVPAPSSYPAMPTRRRGLSFHLLLGNPNKSVGLTSCAGVVRPD